MYLNTLALIEGPYSIYMHLLYGVTLYDHNIYPIYCQHFIWTNVLGAQFLRSSLMYSLIKKQYFLQKGTATRHGLDGPGIESRWGVRFSAPVQTGSEAQPASYTMHTGSFPGVKRLGRGVDHPPQSSAEVKERV